MLKFFRAYITRRNLKPLPRGPSMKRKKMGNKPHALPITHIDLSSSRVLTMYVVGECKNFTSGGPHTHRELKISCFYFKGWNQLNHHPVLKFPHFFTASLQAKTAGISKLVDAEALSVFKIKTNYLYSIPWK